MTQTVRAASEPALAPTSWRHRLTVREARMCPGCGADADTTLCHSCGRPTTLGTAAQNDRGLGQAFNISRLMRKQTVIRLEHNGESSRCVTLDGHLMEVRDAKLSESSFQVPELTRTLSTAGRLALWIAAARDGLIESSIPPAVLGDAACAATAVDLFEARRLGQDLISLGLGDVISGLQLPNTERAWLTLVGAARWGRGDAGVTALASLPHDRYRPKVWLIARLWPWLSTMNVSDTVRAHVEPFLHSEPMARALHLLCTRRAGSAEISATIRETLASSGLDTTLPTNVSASLRRVDGESHERAGARFGPADRALEHLDPRSSCPPPVETDLAALAEPLQDDLIDLGRFPLAAVHYVAGAERQDYLTARLDPRSLGDSSVASLGFFGERARRALIRRDVKAAPDLGHSPMAAHVSELLKVTQHRHDDVVLDNVRIDDRPIVEDLLRVCGTSARGEPPMAGLTPRLLADRSTWPVIREMVPSELMRPTLELKERHAGFAEWLSLVSARELLFRSRWREAVASARFCLTLATDEAVRDEALNLLACGLHQMGDDEAAIAALEKAIEGAYSESLLANIGVVAARLRPELAARYLGKLVDEAPTTGLKVAAARQIVQMWQTSETSTWDGSDGDTNLPSLVRDPVRAVLVADMALDDFRHLAQLLANTDAPWLARADLSASPHRTAIEARYWVAAAQGPQQRLDVMASVPTGAAPDWFDVEIESYASGLIDYMIERLVEDDTDQEGPAELSLAMAERVARLPDDIVCRLVFIGSALLLDHYQATHTFAAELMAKRLAKGRTLHHRLAPEQIETLTPISELAHKKLAFNYVLGSVAEIQPLMQRTNALTDRFRMTADLAVLEQKRAVVRQVMSTASTYQRLLTELLPYLPKDDPEPARILRDRIAELQATEVESRGLL